MDKLGESLVVLTSKADENDNILCHLIIDECPYPAFSCRKCVYYNHKLLDKPIEILNKLGE